MPRYFYTARSQKGELRTGIMEARDEHELSGFLRQEGSILVKASWEGEGQGKAAGVFPKRWLTSIIFLGRVGLKDKMFFTRNLKVMIASGISLPRALKILAEQTKSKKFKSSLLDIAEKVTRGESFSQAMAGHSDIFSELFQNMIKVGEEAGTLEDVLATLSEQMEKENEMRSKILGATIYPAVIVAAMVGIGILMLVMVIPKLAETFKELGVDLPPTTRFVIGLGTFMSEKWHWTLLIVIAVFFLFRIFFKSRPGKKLAAALFLKIPVISSLVRKSNSASTVRTLSSLITAGVPIVRSLEIISRTLGNVYFRKAMAEAAEKVRKGEKLHQALRPYRELYSSLVVEMIEIGEETGETSSVLTKLADFYEEEVASATKNLSSVIEPFLMLLIGATVGFFAISMIQPMYAMLRAIQ